MGICPVAYGKVMGNLPEGLILPVKMPASGLPPAMPGCQISTMASQTGSRRQSSNGRPLERISTIGLPVFFSSIANFSCIFGKAMEAREAFSPLQFRFSPRQSRMTSAFPAVATASAKPDSSLPSKSHPLAYSSCDKSFSSSFSPS